jgi:4-diphosphocytidyl-2-C-methyl-D-erythritol kinase
MRAIRAFAPAKINLALHVATPQADGRHPLASIVCFADVGDEVTLSEGDDFVVSGPFSGALAGEQNNLVLRALDLLPHKGAVRGAVRAHLEKNLPVASGIGGGSSDAAATLRAASIFFQRGLDENALANLAGEQLGADLRVCIFAKTALVRGTGDDVSLMQLPPFEAVLINPLIPLSTASVFRRYDELGRFGDLDMPGPLAPAFKDSRNDLEPAACSLVPEIAEILGWLRMDKRVLLGRMSGSGATCFALVPNRDSALGLAADLSRRFPAAWVMPARLGDVDVRPRES